MNNTSSRCADPGWGLSPLALLDLLEQRRYGVEYQPLVAADSQRIAGYEALARFFDRDGRPWSPQSVFDALHASPISLFQVEYALKQLQLAHAPAHGALFVNLDPDAFAAADVGVDTHPLADLLAGESRVVVEVIENSNLNDALMSRRLVELFVARGVPLALDDIGAPSTMLALPVLLAVDYLKFDRAWLGMLSDPVCQAALRHLIAFARETGKRTVLEGIETEAQRRQAVELGVDYLQGFLFRSAFCSVRGVPRATLALC